eukprot:scaffold1075_cov104-Cylindrotheca_fusiformis.AAC.2
MTIDGQQGEFQFYETSDLWQIILLGDAPKAEISGRVRRTTVSPFIIQTITSGLEMTLVLRNREMPPLLPLVENVLFLFFFLHHQIDDIQNECGEICHVMGLRSIRKFGSLVPELMNRMGRIVAWNANALQLSCICVQSAVEKLGYVFSAAACRKRTLVLGVCDRGGRTGELSEC